MHYILLHIKNVYIADATQNMSYNIIYIYNLYISISNNKIKKYIFLFGFSVFQIILKSHVLSTYFLMFQNK
jgi:hypothetical protein